MNLLCHDIISDTYAVTFEWLKATQINAPDSKSKVVFTKIDQLNEKSETEEKVNKFVKEFCTLIDKEIRITRNHRENCESNSPNLCIYDKRIHNYEDLKQQLKQRDVLLVSCKPGYEERLTQVREFLLNFADRPENMILLRAIDIELFVKIGKLGLKKPMLEEAVVKQDGNQAINEGTQSLNKGASTSQISQPSDHYQKTVDEQKLQHEQSLHQQYITIDEVAEALKPILKEHGIVVDDLIEEAKLSLDNLSKKGLLAYFAGDMELEQIVFNDLSTLINVIRCIFHHNVENHLKFDDTLSTGLYQGSEWKFQKDVEGLKQHGILTMALLKVLLLKGRCSIESSVVLKLLSRLDVAVSFKTTTSNEEVLFVPYFIENVLAPEDFNMKNDDVMRCSGNVLSLRTVVKGDLPIPYFHQLLVKVHRKLHGRHSFQASNITWNKGLWATLGECDAKLMIHYKSKNEIEFTVQADMDDADGRSLIWDYLKQISSDSKSIKTSKFPGMALDYLIECILCAGTEVNDAQFWRVEDMISCQLAPMKTLKCRNSHTVPTVLMSPQTQGLSELRSKQQHKELLEALSKHCKRVNELKPPHSGLRKLSDKCRLKVVYDTIEVQEVIDVLGKVDQSFCHHLNSNIITSNMRQEIEKARNSSEGLGRIRTALKNSLVPDQLDIVIRVLRENVEGAKLHADQIQECYFEEIRKHTCAECGTKGQPQPVPDDSQPSISKDINPAKDMEHTNQQTLKRRRSSEPQPAPDDSQPSISEDINPGKDMEHTTQPTLKRRRSSEPQPAPANIQPFISEDINPSKDMEHTTQLTVKSPRSSGTSQEQCQYQGLEAEFQKYHLLEKLTTEQKTSCPNDRLLAIIAQKCAQSMCLLGIHLGFDLNQVKNFRSNSQSSVQDQFIEMLDDWRKKKNERATVVRLIKALQKSDISEQSYRQAVLDYFKGSDDDTDTED